MISFSSFTAGRDPLPDDVASAISTCVAAMTRLNQLRINDLSLPILKALAERMEPLDDVAVFSPPGVNWVSVNVFC